MTGRSVTNNLHSQKLLSISELQLYLSLGRTTADKVGVKAGAKRKIGKRALYDREAIDKYIDNLA